MASRLTAQIRRLSELLSEASKTLDVIAAELDTRASPAPATDQIAAEHANDARQAELLHTELAAIEAKRSPPAPPSSAEREPEPNVEPPWEDIVERAITLLGKEPRRTWKPAELCRAVRDSGVKIDSLQGLHFGLMPRLRQRGAIREGSAGFQASELLAKESVPAPPPSAPRPAEPPAPKPQRELPWAQIIRAATRLLHDDPDRAWGQAELVRAVRDSGVPLDNLQGIHFGLTGRLVGLGLADANNEGKLRLSSLVGGHDSGPKQPPAASPSHEPADEVDALTEEVDACELFLDRMSVAQRTAQVAVWAGRAREIQERWKDADVTKERRAALRQVFGRLTRITRELQCEWVDALTPGWSMPWAIYIAHQNAVLAGEEAPLLDEEVQTLWRARLRGLMVPHRHVSPREASEVIGQASDSLDAGDDDLRAAKQRFGEQRRAVPPAVRRAAPAPEPVAEVAPVAAPPEVLALTRGKKAVIVGGTGTREEHRQKLQKLLELGELDWATVERGATGAFGRIEERIKHSTYDLVLFLAGYTSHKSVPLLKACKARGVPLVYLPRGYSGAQVVHAIAEQLVAPAARQNG